MTPGIGLTGSPTQVAALRQQLAANPADRIARHNLAVELRKCGQHEEALAEIRRFEAACHGFNTRMGIVLPA
mgnify:CR=1 FL=1